MTVVEINGDNYGLDYVEEQVDEYLSVFFKNGRRFSTENIYSLYSNYKHELVAFASIAKMLKDSSDPMYSRIVQKINQLVETLTQKPVLIARRNSNSLTNSLSYIGAIHACLGRLDTFIPFMKEVVTNFEYVSESSLEEFHGRQFIILNKFTLPDGVDPYKSNLDSRDIYAQVYDRIFDLIADMGSSRLIGQLMQTDFYIQEQIAHKLPIQRMFLYPCDTVKSVHDLVTLFYPKYESSFEMCVRRIFANDSVYGRNGTFRYKKDDAKRFTKEQVPMEYIPYYARVHVEDFDFYDSLPADVNIDIFSFCSYAFQKLDAKFFEDMFKTNKKCPSSFLSHPVIPSIDLPLEFFVKNIQTLYVNTNYRQKQSFQSKYKLQDIVNLLH